MVDVPFTMFTASGDGWAWGVNGVIWSDGYASREAAENAARAELSSHGGYAEQWCEAHNAAYPCSIIENED